MQYTEEQENLIIIKTIDILNDKYKNNEKTTLIDDTVYHILNIISVMGSTNNPLKILDVLAPNTKDAFKLIKANKFGKIIDDQYKKIFEEYQNTRGFFKSFKFKKIAINLINEMYDKIEKENQNNDLISDYLIPYIVENYKEKLADIIENYENN